MRDTMSETPYWMFPFQPERFIIPAHYTLVLIIDEMSDHRQSIFPARGASVATHDPATSGNIPFGTNSSRNNFRASDGFTPAVFATNLIFAQ